MGDKSQKTTSRIDPWLYSQSQHAIRGARSLYDDQRALPSQYVPMHAYTQQGLGMAADIAGTPGGTPVARSSMGEYLGTLRGDYLNANPYMDEVVRRSVGASTSPLHGVFGTAGRFGSGVYANALADAAQETASRLYGANYEAERGRMMQALQMAPTMYGMQFADAEALETIGGKYEAAEAARNAEAMRQFMWPYTKQGLFEQSLAGSPIAADRTTETKVPFDWTGAAMSIFSPSVPGITINAGGTA